MLFEFGGLFRKVWRAALILGAFVIGANTLFVAPVSAATGINEQLNFQGRLLNAQGAVVGDGYYNVEFKIYQDGAGTAAGNPGGTLKWTEDWLNSNSHPVRVQNGYISVQLGSINPFGSSIDWNQDTIWLSVNIGNTSSCTITTNFTANCAGDGEMLPMKRLSAVPYALNSAKLGGLTAAGFIQNTTTVQTATNMAIDGTARADTSILTPLVDTNTAVALNIGTTNATAINLNQNVTVAANKTLTLTGGTTANRPASPTEGMLYYDTSTKQLLTYANGKWQGDRTDVTKIVAASNSSQAAKDAADYVADGTSDQVEINAALTAAAGGKVYLMEGTYTTDDVISIPNNTMLAGSGRGTLIQFANINGQTKNMITNTDTTTGEGVTIRDLRLDGNKTVNTTGTMNGLYMNGVGGASGATARNGVIIVNTWAFNFKSAGIYLVSSSNGTLTNNTSQGNGGNGIYLDSSNRANLSNNTVQGNGASGIWLAASLYDVVSSNNIIANTNSGIGMNGNSAYNVISSNIVYNNTASSGINSINLASVNNNQILDNSITDTAGTGAAIGIDSASANNYISNNVFSGTGATTISDASTTTIYASQSRAAGGGQITNRTANDTQSFAVQNASGANIFAVDTTNSQLVVGNSSTVGKINLSDGSSNTLTLSVGSLAGNYSITIPTITANDTVCLQTLANCGTNLTVGALDGGTANANGMTISGSNVYLQSASASYAGLVNTTTQTFAGAKTFNESLTLAAAKTINMAGSTTANRPASPTEGMLYYDTSTKQLVVYSNGKWQSDRNTSTKIVAASNASQALKDGADYVATGANDQTTINNALTAAAGGKVYLTEGKYTIGDSVSVPNNTTLAGAGAGTVITFPNGFGLERSVIVNTDTTTGTGIGVRDLKIDGNSANISTGNGNGIYLVGVGSDTSGSVRAGANITNVIINNLYNGPSLASTVVFDNTSNSSITNSTLGSGNIYIHGGHNTVSDNYIFDSAQVGIYLDSASNNTVTDNIVQGAQMWGIYLYNSHYNAIGTNRVSDTGGSANNDAIYLDASDNNTITNNTITDSSATTTNYAINIAAATADNNYITGNTLGGGSINNAGTGTVYGGQLSGTGNFLIQPAGTIELMKNTNVTGTLSASTSVLAPTFDTATGVALNIGKTTATSISIGKSSITTTLSSSTINVGTSGSTTNILGATQTTNNTAGNDLVIQGSTGLGSGNGGNVKLQGGNGGTTGLYGGNLTLAGGTGTTSNGVVVLATSAFQTATADTGCFPGGSESTSTSNCSITQNSINNNASVIIGFTNDGQTAFMPDPSILTAGRVVYVTASGATKDFTLSVNGGGQGNQIAMRKNTTATMIWNGADWTAAGASSSTTLQAAYDNTLQSAGGAELVVSKTGATNGLTIRDSATNSVNGALLTVQSSSAANLFSVNSNVTEYTSNSGAESYSGSTSTFPASTWVALTGSTVTRNTTTANIATGQGSAQVATITTAGSGVKNVLNTSLTAGQHYNVSFSTKLSSGTFTDLGVYYSVDGSTNSITCTTNQSIKTSVWTKVNCTFTAPSSGITSANSINIRQIGGGTARTFYVDNISVTIAADYNYATDGDADDVANFSTNWPYTTGIGTGSTTRNGSDGFNASSSAGVTITAGAINAGLRNKLSINPLTSTLYRVSVYAKSSNAFNDFKIRYSPNGGTSYVDCVDYNTQVLTTSSWTQVTCYITTDATAVSNPYIYFVESTSATRTFYVDAFSMTLASSSTPNVQIGSGSNGGPTTLFTVDKGASAPIAANNDALLGSMYYDTTLGKLQCYEADGWGACGSSPDNIVTISPEYTNAVMHGTGVGTMTSDICSDALDINDGTSGQPTICGTNETYNLYKWTSPQATPQTYSIYVTYQLPDTFKEFASGQTSVMGRTDNANSTVQYQIYRSNSSTGMTPCGSAVTVSTGTQTSWQPGQATGAADPSTCSFAAGDSIVFKISMTSSSNANAYIGNLGFTFSNR